MRPLILLLAAIATASAAEPADAILQSYWAAHNVAVPAPVSDAVFARRVYLDVWGLVPTPAQLSEFLGDRRPEKRRLLVEQLLANRRNYSEHWVSFWNDLLRNDEGVIYHGDRQTITKWLLQALEDNMPYDRFVSALLNPPTPDGPAGFLIGVNWRGDVSASQTPPLQAAQNSAQVFLGINLKCNSCHDSFISKWKLKDAYGMASFFSDAALEIYRCDVKTGEKSAPKFLYPNMGSVDPDASLAERRAAVARFVTAPENTRFPRTFVNRVWRRLLGRGLVEPVDDMDRAPWSADLLNALADDFVAHKYDIGFLIERIMTSAAYQSPAVMMAQKEKNYVFRGPLPRRLTAEQFADSVSAITGEWRVRQSNETRTSTYSREWRLKSTPLTRTLGRPIRDQVYTERAEDATTLQALEMVNGETMAGLMRRGAMRMLNQLPPAPVSVFDSGSIGSKPAEVDIDITGVTKLWLLTEDADSYDRARVVAGWAKAEFSAGGAPPVPLAGATGSLQFKEKEPAAALITALPSQQVIDIAGKGYTRFRATAGVDQQSLPNEINPHVRFFVFTQEPDHHQLVRVDGEPPVAGSPENVTGDKLIARLYHHALARDPQPAESRVAREFLKGKRPVEGLQDLLWAIFLSPEFQYVY